MTTVQSEALLTVLREIRDVLAQIAATPDQAGVVEEDRCLHPEERRVSLATLREPDHWICSACKYDHHGVEDDAQATL